jgi:hypothetical protein
MPPLSLGKMLTSFRSIYKSIDIRVACFQEEAMHWRNVLTLVRFSNEEESALHQRLVGLLADYDNISDEKFRIVVEARPFIDWKAWNSQFAAGEVRIRDLTVSYDSRQDLESLTGRLTLSGHYAINEYEGKVFEAFTTCNKTPEQTLRAYDASAVRAGFRDTYEVINSLLHARFGGGMTTDLIVLAPALATVRIGDLDPNTGDLTVVSRVPVELTNCQLYVLLRSDGRRDVLSSPIKSRKRVNVATQEIAASSGLVDITTPIRLDSLEVQDWLEVRLILDEIELFEQSGPIERYFTKPWLRVAPLYDVFRTFKAKSSFEDLLLQPTKTDLSIRGRKTKPDELFERSVCWLMSFLGFSCIKMDEREDLYEPATEFKIGSIDLLAYHETAGIFLIAGCSLTAPSRDDIEMMRRVTKTISESVLKNRVRRIVTAFFTLAEDLSLIKQEAATQGVLIYELGHIEQILKDFSQKKGTASVL